VKPQRDISQTSNVWNGPDKPRRGEAAEDADGSSESSASSMRAGLECVLPEAPRLANISRVSNAAPVTENAGKSGAGDGGSVGVGVGPRAAEVVVCQVRDLGIVYGRDDC